LYWRNWADEDHRIHVILSPWEDHFPKQRNKYLRFVGKFIQEGDWLLSTDPDETPDEFTLQKLNDIANECEDENYNIAGFKCRSESYRGKNRVWDNVDEYWKHLFYRWHPDIHYDEAKNPHETLLIPGGNRMKHTPYIYSHKKQENTIWIRGARNLFVGGGGPNLGESNKRWVDLRQICSAHGINTWHEFHNAMINGNIPSMIKDWMIKYHNIDGFDGASEHREVYKTYFRIYHPEEEPNNIRGVHIP
jgi:hypothetical protein